MLKCLVSDDDFNNGQGSLMIKTKKFMKITQQLPALQQRLDEACELLLPSGLVVNAEQRNLLLLYLDRLLLWNEAYNLTAIKNPQEALIKHIFDCLSIVPYLPQGRLLDVGTGAGLPSAVIAICQPDRDCTALDSNQKKIRFIKQMVSELALKNLTPVASRIEQHQEQYDVVTSRAFASLEDFVAVADPCLLPNGSLSAMKAKLPEKNQLAILQQSWHIETQTLQVPDLTDERRLVILTRK